MVKIASDNANKYDAFIFIHIPRCGGVSFRKMVNKIALAQCISKGKLYIPGCNGISNRKSLPRLDNKEMKLILQNDPFIIADHSPINYLETLGFSFGNPFYYTMLREPVDRFISEYNFCCYARGDDGLKDKSLNELDYTKLRNQLKKRSNRIMQFLSGSPMRYNARILDLAKDNLQNKLACFGLLEYQDQSMTWLKRTMPDWLPFDGDYPKFHELEKRPAQDVVQTIRDEIKIYNSLDRILYTFAKDLLLSRASLE